MRAALMLCAVLAVACSTDPVYLKNPSGEVVSCGPYYTGLDPAGKIDGIAARESQCIQDYKEQGYNRVPHP